MSHGKRNWVGCASTRAVRAWSYFQKAVHVAEEEIKEAGLSRTSWRRVKDRLEGERPPVGAEKAFRGRVRSFVRQEGAQVPARQKYLGRSDVLESLFGKYKDLAAQAPCREITANVLMIPLLVTSLTADLLRQALETIRAQDVEEWLKEHLVRPQQCCKTVADPRLCHTGDAPPAQARPSTAAPTRFGSVAGGRPRAREGAVLMSTSPRRPPPAPLIRRQYEPSRIQHDSLISAYLLVAPNVSRRLGSPARRPGEVGRTDAPSGRSRTSVVGAGR
jgi:hypothetical protein